MGKTGTIDVNADFGEGFGVYPMPSQVWRSDFARGGGLAPPEDTQAVPIERYLRLVSSVNLSCGFHAGDPLLIKRYVALSLREGCFIGAHVSFPDLAGFGNRYMKLAPDDLKAVLQYQFGALAGLVGMHGRELSHVKSHGALYNHSMIDEQLATTVTEAVAEFDDTLPLYGLPDSAMEEAVRRAGLRFVREGYSDRAYHSSGLLVDRSMEQSMVLDADTVAERVVLMARDGIVRSIEGEEVAVKPDTISFHSDTPSAWEILTASATALNDAGIEIAGCQTLEPQR